MRKIALLLATLACALGANAIEPSRLGAPAADNRFTVDPGPEPQLARILDEIDGNRLTAALEQTDGLIRRYPNFRLAHLIKGDLLLARSRPLSTFGNAANAPPDHIADLRDEAIARLKAYRDKSSPARFIPRYLLQMRPDQRFALVVDTDKARLYVYRNDEGRPAFVADYYLSHGKMGSEKLRQGDRKTPIGVYHVTSSLPAETLDSYYGNGAFPLNYPNDWDKWQGRDGSGIWLHGTPPDTYSRPPRASDGCIVLTNSDLKALSGKLQLGITPVIISNSVEWLSFEDWQNERDALNARIEEWRSDWESRDYDRVARHYAKDFKPGGPIARQFAQLKRRRAADKESLRVTLGNRSIFRNPGKEQMVVVSFDQDLRSNGISSQTRKSQYWIREDGTWKIIYEGNA